MHVISCTDERIGCGQEGQAIGDYEDMQEQNLLADGRAFSCNS
jgi:hypothetical protein